MATRKDVADYAKVSVATVSYVVNHTKNVTPEVRARVEEAIKELDYRPNMIARGLAMKQTQHVAMFVNNLKNPYYSEMLAGAQTVASEHGYIVSIIMIDYSNQEEILKLAARGVDGVIVATASSDETAQLIGNSIPFAKCGDYVDIDYRPAIYDSVKALRDHGHKKIAYLSGLKMNNRTHIRYTFVKDALERNGLVCDPLLMIDGDERENTDEEAGREAVRKLIASGEKFTAILALNDLMALGAITELHECGLSVPEDVSVTGCDDIQISQFCVPKLSTIDVSSFEIGSLLMKQLLGMIEHRRIEERTVTAVYIERESVGDCPAKFR